MKRLSSLMGTYYLCDWMAERLSRVLSGQTEVDLALCKFSPGCERVLHNFYQKVKFVNTDDDVLNRMVERNCIAANTKKPETKPLKFVFDSMEEAIMYKKNLSRGTIYDLSRFPENQVKCCAMATIILLNQPEIILDLGSYAVRVFEYVRKTWLKYWSPQEVYAEAVGKCIIKRRVREDSTIYVKGKGVFTEEIYVKEMAVALPGGFGREKLSSHPAFKETVEQALKTIAAKPKKADTMKSYIEVDD